MDMMNLSERAIISMLYGNEQDCPINFSLSRSETRQAEAYRTTERNRHEDLYQEVRVHLTFNCVDCNLYRRRSSSNQECEETRRRYQRSPEGVGRFHGDHECA